MAAGNNGSKLTNELQGTFQQGKPEQDTSRDDAYLQQLVEQYRDICLELLTALERLKSDSQLGTWNNFCAALKTVWGENKIRSLQERLNEVRRKLIIAYWCHSANSAFMPA